MNECRCSGWKRNYSSRPNWKYCPYCGGIINKPEPKQPTHEEKFASFWKGDENEWLKCHGYDDVLNVYFVGEVWVSESWFTDKESADIPPEAE